MISEHLQEQACLYAAGALPPKEARELEAALRRDAELRRLVEELREASALIASGIPQLPPPPGLKQALFDRIDAGAAAVLNPDFRPVPRAFSWISLAAAACFAGLCLVLVWNGRSTKQQTAELADKIKVLEAGSEKLTDQTYTVQTQAGQITLLQQQLQSAAQRLITLSTQTLALQNQAGQTEVLRRELDAMNRRANDLSTLSDALRAQIAELQSAQRISLMQISLLKSLLEDSPDSVGVSVWDKEHQKGVFVADKLPTLPDDKTYQLWILDPKYTMPVSAGVFVVDATGRARVEFTPTLPVDRSDRLAVSIERTGGVPQPEGKIVLLTQ